MRWIGALLLLLAGVARAQPAPELVLSVTGPARPALLPSAGCNPPDVADAPARALRLADGTVQLYASDQVNRANAGPDLVHLHHDCTVLYRGSGQDDPAAFDDRSWVASLWSPDGRTVWAIMHNEYHGNERPASCPTRRYMDCWYNALTLARSIDGGPFQRADPALVAALPYRYDELPRGHHGYFNPTNIVPTDDGHWVMIAFTTQAGAQQPGNCLLRSDDPAVAGSWRGWNGHEFSVVFIDPYRKHDDPAAHVCAPIGSGALKWPVTSLAWHASKRLFLAVMQDAGMDGGIYYATSHDLVQWTAPARLMPAIGLAHWDCRAPNAVAYPALLDPASEDRTFATVDHSALLFATRFETTDCVHFAARTLIRLPIEIRSAH